MQKTTRILALALLLLGAVVMTSVGIGSGGNEAGTQTHSTANNWSVTALPYMGSGYESRPVVVTSVISTATREYRVTGVVLKNISSKPAIAVKLEWGIFHDKAKDALLRRKTQLIDIDVAGGIPEHKHRTLKFPILSLSDISKALTKEGTIQGHFRIEIGVAEVIFNDGSTWTVGQPQKSGAAFVNATYLGRSVPLKITPLPPISQTGCAKEDCRYNAGPPHFWDCNDTGNPVFCTNCGGSCCNTICGQPRCECPGDS